jgi:hypothetical protein
VNSICATGSVLRTEYRPQQLGLDLIDGEFSSILASSLGFLPSLITSSALANTFGGIVRPILFGRFQIDDELELRRLLHRQVRAIVFGSLCLLPCHDNDPDGISPSASVLLN